jgi:hypothetical protein
MHTSVKRLRIGEELNSVLLPEERYASLADPTGGFGRKGRSYGPGSEMFSCGAYLRLTRAAIASGAWPSANKPIAIPFVLSQAAILQQVRFRTGSAAGGNGDVGIYDTSFNRIVSSGSTAFSASSSYQLMDIADTALAPGRYYLAFALDNITANRVGFIAATSSTLVTRVMGCLDSTTNAFPLPNPLTNMVAAATFVRIPGFSLFFNRNAFP